MKKNSNLTKKERDMLQAFERGEFKSVGNLEKRRKEVANAARAVSLKNQRINIRMREEDLITIKKKA